MQNSKLHMPARIDPEMEAKIKDTALTIYHVLGCSGFARVDMFLTLAKEIVLSQHHSLFYSTQPVPEYDERNRITVFRSSGQAEPNRT